jgi:hypothetical protein
VSLLLGLLLGWPVGAGAIMAGARPDSPEARVDPNTTGSPWTGVGTHVIAVAKVYRHPGFKNFDYLNSLRTASDVLLVIEVSDTTLVFDRDVKVPLYAAQDVSECWLVDVNARRLEMYRDPGADGYRTLLRPDRDATVSPLAVPDAAIDLKALFAGSA